MPNLYSAVKRMRVAEKAHLRNRAAKSGISTSRRELFETCAGKDFAKSRQAFSAYCSILDKAAIKGLIKRNTAIRRKRRAAAKLAAISSAEQSAG